MLDSEIILHSISPVIPLLDNGWVKTFLSSFTAVELLDAVFSKQSVSYQVLNML